MSLVKEYIEKLKEDLDTIKELEVNLKIIAKILILSKQVFVCGNGGSSTTASHFTNDLQKICKLRAICLTDNTPLITAWSNDYSYDYIFVKQLEVLSNSGDTIVVFTGSGKSDNILNVIRWGLRNNLNIIAFVGMDGGYIVDKENIKIIHIPTDMLHSEDCHLIVCHLLSKLIKKENGKERNRI